MTVLMITIPVSLLLGAVGLAAFLWSLKSGQYRDLEGDAARILFSDDDAPPEDREPRGEAPGPEDDEGDEGGPRVG
ncbi:MAG: cbb3-type cytochrome oxidase assembly protein CcoS [Paracoccaceae bacterium]